MAIQCFETMGTARARMPKQRYVLLPLLMAMWLSTTTEAMVGQNGVTTVTRPFFDYPKDEIDDTHTNPERRHLVSTRERIRVRDGDLRKRRKRVEKEEEIETDAGMDGVTADRSIREQRISSDLRKRRKRGTIFEVEKDEETQTIFKVEEDEETAAGGGGARIRRPVLAVTERKKRVSKPQQ
eukprot:scaffold1012_cov45-Attheya_sp.AAC.2